MAELIDLFLETHFGKFLAFLFTSVLIVWILRTYRQYLAAKRANHHEERARLLEGTVGKLIDHHSELINEKVEQRVDEELEKKRLENIDGGVAELELAQTDSPDQVTHSSTDNSENIVPFFLCRNWLSCILLYGAA